jgi:hypothetical protein
MTKSNPLAAGEWKLCSEEENSMELDSGLRRNDEQR